MRTWADDAGLSPPAVTVDRDAGEGPQPRCCARRFVAADMLVYYGEAPPTVVEKVTERFQHFKNDPDAMYLCDACREVVRREKVLDRTEMVLSRELKVPDAL